LGVIEFIKPGKFLAFKISTNHSTSRCNFHVEWMTIEAPVESIIVLKLAFEISSNVIRTCPLNHYFRLSIIFPHAGIKTPSISRNIAFIYIILYCILYTITMIMANNIVNGIVDHSLSAVCLGSDMGLVDGSLRHKKNALPAGNALCRNPVRGIIL